MLSFRLKSGPSLPEFLQRLSFEPDEQHIDFFATDLYEPHFRLMSDENQNYLKELGYQIQPPNALGLTWTTNDMQEALLKKNGNKNGIWLRCRPLTFSRKERFLIFQGDFYGTAFEKSDLPERPQKPPIIPMTGVFNTESSTGYIHILGVFVKDITKDGVVT